MSRTMPARGDRTAVLAPLLALLLAGATWPPAARADQFWESWGQETYRLEPGESLQFSVAYEDIPVRSWRLVVEGDYILCDLHVLRLRGFFRCQVLDLDVSPADLERAAVSDTVDL